MGYLEAAGLALLILPLALILIFARRSLISRRGGTIGMSMRLSTYVPGRGWAPGIGQFTADELRWYRLFSLSPRPRRVLLRHTLSVEERRPPQGPERLSMPEGWVVLRCSGGRRSAYSRRSVPDQVELALAESAVTAFLSWIESAPPRALSQS
ncbi:MAG: DUF2550 domain-containing protein [Micromonosporaceae bacterium]|nr:DUF2550 domain-containing protein [Micromonosporaceae bacterium]